MPLDASQDRAPYEMAGAATLAEQPVNETEKQKPDKPWWGVTFAHLESRLGMLRTWRYSWWAYWAELARYILPRRYKWLVTANTMDRGFPINDAIIDGRPTQAMLTCAAGLFTGLMSPSRPWFGLDIGVPGLEIDAAGKDWLEDTEERVLIVMAQSNLYQIFQQAFQDVSTFGTAPVIIYEDFEDIIRCYAPCAGEYYLASSARMTVDTMYREYTYTVAQIVEWFTIESCPQQIREKFDTGGASLELEYVICHAIEPNFDLSDKGGGKVKVIEGKFVYREVYWLKGMKTDGPLSRRGFHEKAFVTLRWALVSNDAYGRSPAMDALGDIKQIQQETRRKGEFLEKGIRPPMGADPELKNEPASIMPGHITYTMQDGGKKGFWPLFEVNAAWMQPVTADIDGIAKRVDVYFFTDVFMMISQMEGIQPRNELEIAERKGEKVMRLGPVIEDFEGVAGEVVRRVMAIMERRGLLKPKPPSLKGLPIQIKYTSILKLAQRAAETASMEGSLRVVGPLSQAAQLSGSPAPGRLINYDKWLREFHERVGAPDSVLYSEAEVQAHDQAKAKAQAAANAMQTSLAAVGAAKDLGQTDVGGGQTAAGLLLGTGGPAPGQGAAK